MNIADERNIICHEIIYTEFVFRFVKRREKLYLKFHRYNIAYICEEETILRELFSFNFPSRLNYPVSIFDVFMVLKCAFCILGWWARLDAGFRKKEVYACSALLRNVLRIVSRISP